ncbi:MAG TPA: hypothetical protein PKN11_04670 [Anaerolineaceae bacterium]|nr:hypothetical protein [Anaerolineaceae bacterium]
MRQMSTALAGGSNAALPFPCQAMPRVPPPRRFAQPVRLLQTLSKLAEFG